MTQVSWKRQLMLAVALFALGTFAYWLEFKHKPQTEEKETRSKKLFDLKESPVDSIQVTSAGKTFVFSCQDFAQKLCKPGDNSKWDLTAPARLRGDDSNVNSFLSALNTTEASDTIDLKDETPEKRAALLKDYGLDPASRNAATVRKIEVKTATGATIVYFGGTHPIGDGIFSAIETVPTGGKASGAIDDTRVLLVPSYFKNNLEHDLTYWRDKKILTVHDTDLASFKLESTKSGTLSGQKTNGEWTLTAGKENYTGDSEAITTLLNGMSFLTAKDFASESKTDAQARDLLKGTKAVLTLTLQKQAEKPAASPSPKADAPAPGATPPAPIVVTFLAKSGPAPVTKKGEKKPNVATPGISKLYVTVSDKDPLYEVDTYAKDRFEKSLKDLRMSKLLTAMDRFTVKRIEFAGQPIGEPSLVLTNTDGKWMQDKKEIDGSKVSTLLDKLTSNKIREFVEGSAIPTGQDKGLRVSLGDEKTPTKLQFVFWKTDAKLYVRDLHSPRKEAYLFDNSVGDSLPMEAAKARAFFEKSANPAPTASALPPPIPRGMIPGAGGLPRGMGGLPPGHPPIGRPMGAPPSH